MNRNVTWEVISELVPVPTGTSYRPADTAGSVMTINSTGLVTATGPGRATIRATTVVGGITREVTITVDDLPVGRISAGDGSPASPSKRFILPIRVESNDGAGIAGVTFVLDYDANILTLISAAAVHPTLPLNMFTRAAAVTSPAGARTHQRISLIDPSYRNPIGQFEGTGPIVELAFTVTPGALNLASTTSIGLRYTRPTDPSRPEEPVGLPVNSSGNQVNFILQETTIISISEILYGDVNDDGRVDNADLLLLKRYFAGPLPPGTRFNMNAADVVIDGKVEQNDLTLLLEFFARPNIRLGIPSTP
jgi:hypothetical protein